MAQKVNTRGSEAGPTKGTSISVVWMVATAVALVISAAGLFAAGYFTHDLVTEDDGGGQVVFDRGTPAPQPTAVATAAPPSVVQVSSADAPSWGPADAEVTVVEFSDYQ
ncbi:MAG TPA: hypothetical protein VJ578_03575 [Dehalococcoidia bacterium]|nr:hypothetical protein [Dehalococcoidia bacterium]